MKMKGTVGYAPNPNNRKRNQVVYYFFITQIIEHILYLQYKIT